MITGSIDLLIKSPLGTVLTVSSGQLVILGLVLVALASGFVLLKPEAMRIVKADWPKDPSAAIPEPVVSSLKTLVNGSMVTTAIVVIVRFLMVSAATGGL